MVEEEGVCLLRQGAKFGPREDRAARGDRPLRRRRRAGPSNGARVVPRGPASRGRTRVTRDRLAFVSGACSRGVITLDHHRKH
jgi:hypothetical protein